MSGPAMAADIGAKGVPPVSGLRPGIRAVIFA